MAKMHENELEIDESFVRKLLENQCPQWSNYPLSAITSSGTDNALFRLGNEFVVRLPRVEWEPGSIEKSINKEYEWIPQLAKLLTTSISAPIFKGNPDSFYPWSWLIVKWNDGLNPVFEENNEYALLAADLAHFLNELHGVKLSHGPLSRRGVPLQKIDAETKKAIGELSEDLDSQLISSLWEQLLTTPSWEKELVWIHGDFLPGNILIQNHSLSGVIDFSDVGMGDPACDLIIAWSLFNKISREIFRKNLKNSDENTWRRGKAWALSIALIMLPYYKNTNPILATLARRMIKNIMCDLYPD